MKLFSDITELIPCTQRNRCNTGKIIFKTVAVTAAVLAFVPTIIKINKGKGFEAYALLSKVEYKKTTDDEGNVCRDVSIRLIDLERYGIDLNKNETETEEADEDSISIEE